MDSKPWMSHSGQLGEMLGVSRVDQMACLLAVDHRYISVAVGASGLNGATIRGR